MTPGEVAWQAALRATRETLRRYPGIDRDEVLSDACLGAAYALRRYNPGRGVPLSFYALERARGAVLDGIRQRTLHTRAGHPRAVEVPYDGARRPSPRVSDEQTVDDRDELDRLLERLPPRLAFVLREHDLHDQPMAVLARALGVSDSRICQLRREALAQARAVA